MRITHFSIRRFRSVESLDCQVGDRRFVVIEGENDAGKSNVVEALHLAFRALPERLRQAAGLPSSLPGTPADWPRNWQPVQANASFRYAATSFEVDVHLAFSDRDVLPDGKPVPFKSAKFGLAWKRRGEQEFPEIALSQANFDDAKQGTPDPGQLAAAAQILVPEPYRLVGPGRLEWGTFRQFGRQSDWAKESRWEGVELASLLFRYKNHPSLEVQQRFEVLRKLLEESPLPIGQLNVALAEQDVLRVRTRQNGAELDIDSRSSGIQQYAMLLALALCHQGRILAIEEPELNLSRTNQRHLWRALRSVVTDRGTLDQIFVTSHSGLFEDEADRFIAVRVDGATKLNPAPLRPSSSEEAESLKVERDGVVHLPEAAQQRLNVTGKEHDDVFLVPSRHGFELVGPEG